MNETSINVVNIGNLRLFRALIDEIGLVDIINNNLTWDEMQCKISPGDLVAAIIMGLFGGHRALYTLAEFFQDQDLELLFGRGGLSPEDFNDDCLGRTLDRLADCSFNHLFGECVLRAKEVHGFIVSACHADTTSFSVYGAYEHEYYPWQEPPLVITHGHSKSHRPDLKQFKLGLATNAEGIPLFGEPLDGNTDDKTWSRSFLEGLAELETVLTETILVLDSAAMSGKSLDLIREAKLRVISRLPETFNLCGEIKEEALRLGAWRGVEFAEDEKRNAQYKVECFERNLAGGTYRFVAVQSQALGKIKRRSIEREVAKERAGLDKAAADLGKKHFATHGEAEQARAAFLAGQAPVYHLVTCRVLEEQAPVKRNKRGRPAKDEVKTYESYFALAVEARRDGAKVEHAKQLAEIFVLFSSVPKLEPSDILGHYKDQAYIENRFRFLKDPCFVEAIYLKKPGRVKAFGYVLILALLIYSLFERRIRKGLLAENEPYHVSGSYRTFTPRGVTVLEALDGLSIVRIDGPGGVKRQLPGNIREKVKRIVRLAGFDISIYIQPATSRTG